MIQVESPIKMINDLKTHEHYVFNQKEIKLNTIPKKTGEESSQYPELKNNQSTSFGWELELLKCDRWEKLIKRRELLEDQLEKLTGYVEILKVEENLIKNRKK